MNLTGFTPRSQRAQRKAPPLRTSRPSREISAVHAGHTKAQLGFSSQNDRPAAFQFSFCLGRLQLLAGQSKPPLALSELGDRRLEVRLREIGPQHRREYE